MPRFAPHLLVVPACLLGGCAQVSIESGPGQARLERHWGVLAISFPDNKASHVVQVRSLGLTQSPLGWSAGYTHQSWASLDQDCRLVIWVSEDAHLATARQLANSNNKVCVVSPQPHQQEDIHHESRSTPDRARSDPGP